MRTTSLLLLVSACAAAPASGPVRSRGMRQTEHLEAARHQDQAGREVWMWKRRARLAIAAMALEIVLGVGAIAGGLALMVGPHGEVIPLPVSALAGSPFASYLVPGAILFLVLGVGPLVAAFLTARHHRLAPFLAFAVGCALIIWIAAEIVIIGYSSSPPLQALYLGLGVAIAGVGCAWAAADGPQPASPARNLCAAPRKRCGDPESP